MIKRSKQELEGVLQNPNVERFLNYISNSEGTNKYGYYTDFGGGKLDNIENHPNNKHRFVQTDGKENVTTASGRYGFLNKTWNGLASQYGLSDFSPHNQDIGAVALLDQSGALDDVLNGNYTSAINKSGKIWASLPSSPYAQPKRSWKEANNFFGKNSDSGLDISSVAPKTQINEPIKKEFNIDNLMELYGISTPKDSGDDNSYDFTNIDPMDYTSIYKKAKDNYVFDGMPSLEENPNTWIDRYVDKLVG